MSWLDGLRHRVHVWRHRGEYAREQEEERRFHRDMERLDGRVGGSGGGGPPELPSSGSVGLPTRLLESLRRDLAYALRSLARAPGFTAMAVLTLALGVGANGAVFSLLDRIFGQPPAGLEAPEALRRLYFELPDHPAEPGMIWGWFNYPALSVVDQAMSAGGADVAGWMPSEERTVRHEGVPVSARTAYVTADYFSVLGVGAAHGRLFASDEAGMEVTRPLAVISHAFWERVFDRDPGVVGRVMTLASGEQRGRPILDTSTFTVIGVTAEGFTGLDLGYTDLFLHASTFRWPGTDDRPWYTSPGGNFFRAVARLPSTSEDEPFEERAGEAYRAWARVEPGVSSSAPTALLRTGSVIEARGVGRLARPGEEQQAIAISVRAAGVSAMLLLIAGANVAGLLLVRAARRRREIAVRLALGISRARLWSQLLTEGLVLASLSAAGSVLLAAWGGALLRALLMPDVAWTGSPVDARTVLFSVGCALAAGLVAALTPALGARGVDIGEGLRPGRSAGGPTRSAARTTLLVGQTALSVVLLVGAGLFLRSLHEVASLRLGFDVEELAWVDPGYPSDSEEPPAREELASRLSRLPGVSNAALAQWAPMMGYASRRIFLPGSDSLPREIAFPTSNTVAPGFFETVGMRVLEGRVFGGGERDVAVISESMARSLWPSERAVGRCFMVRDPGEPCLEVVGVVEDSRRTRILEDGPFEDSRAYFLPRPGDAIGGVVLLRIDPGRWGDVAAAARREAEGSFAPERVRVRRMSDALEPQLRPWRLGAQLFSAFGILALLVTVVGIYSVMTYVVSQRTHEMGVRLALGAKVLDVLGLVVGEGFRVLAAGVALGVGVALIGGRVVESFLYGVGPRDPLAMAAAVALLLTSGAVASFVPAWRAGQVDPAETLRAE